MGNENKPPAAVSPSVWSPATLGSVETSPVPSNLRLPCRWCWCLRGWENLLRDFFARFLWWDSQSWTVAQGSGKIFPVSQCLPNLSVRLYWCGGDVEAGTESLLSRLCAASHSGWCGALLDWTVNTLILHRKHTYTAQ